MTKNKAQIEKKKNDILAVKLQKPESTEREIARATNTPNATVHRYLKQCGAYLTNHDEWVEGIKAKSLANVSKGVDVEEKFIDQTANSDTVDAQTANVASQITDRNQKRYSFLQSEMTNADGGEKANRFISMSDGDLKVILGES